MVVPFVAVLVKTQTNTQQTCYTIELCDESHSLRQSVCLSVCLSTCLFIHLYFYQFMLILLYLLYNLKDFFLYWKPTKIAYILFCIFFCFVCPFFLFLTLSSSCTCWDSLFWISFEILEVVSKKFLYPWTKLKNSKIKFKMGIPQPNIHSTKYISYLSIFKLVNIKHKTIYNRINWQLITSFEHFIYCW